MSQYLMAGRCILALGPLETGSISLVTALSAGLAIHEEHSEAIQLALRPICDPDWRAVAARNGRNWAMKWLERRQGHERFCQSIQSAQQAVVPMTRRLHPAQQCS
jgi:hypothetical protein